MKKKIITSILLALGICMVSAGATACDFPLGGKTSESESLVETNSGSEENTSVEEESTSEENVSIDEERTSESFDESADTSSDEKESVGKDDSTSEGHSHEYAMETIAPTCVKKGLTTYTCGCGDTYTEEIPATGEHTWENKECTVCGELQVSVGLEYTLSDDRKYYSVAMGVCKDTYVVIPSLYNELPVKVIGARAFSHSELTDIIIPDSITTIEIYAFQNCENLTNVTIPKTVMSIADYAFQNCSSFTKIEIPDNVLMSIGFGAFEGCDNVIEVTLPFVGSSSSGNNLHDCHLGHIFGAYDYTKNSYCVPAALKKVTIRSEAGVNIAPRSFYDCNNLTDVIMLDKVMRIGEDAFDGCTKLQNVSIPASVTTIESGAFNVCSALAGVYITDVKAWCDISFGDSFANPLHHAENLYLNNQLVTELVIPQGTTHIRNYAFFGWENLTKITFSGRVTYIGTSAFQGCMKLTELVTPGSETIADSAFYYCSGLTSVVIGYGAKSIGDNAFRYCSSLTSVEIPDSVTSIGDYAFSNCDSLTSITFTGTVAQWNAITKGDYWDFYMPATKVVCKDGEVAL